MSVVVDAYLAEEAEANQSSNPGRPVVVAGMSDPQRGVYRNARGLGVLRTSGLAPNESEAG